MRFGTYYFLQAPPHLQHALVVSGEVEQMGWTEELGFDSIWFTEHHFIGFSPGQRAALARSVLTNLARLGRLATLAQKAGHGPRVRRTP